MFVTSFCAKLCMLFVFFFVNIKCDLQVGPDPWDLKTDRVDGIDELDVPPDLRAIPKKKIQFGSGAGVSDYFYKRILAIMLKAGEVKRNEDNTVSVSLQMNFDEERWQLLEGCTTINTPLTEDMIRRSIGYIEEAIYKPPIVKKVIIAWSEYIQVFLFDYKVHITWTLGLMASLGGALWLWNHVSHKHIYILVFAIFYLYEVLTSYKEAENKELQRFLSAVNTCKWNLWSSHCDVPPPDPLIFIKHMNPLKIGIRMFTTMITEPMISISETVKILVHGITDGLLFPLNKIVYVILIFSYNIFIIIFLIMIVFNYILNIPFNYSFLGLFNIGLKQRNRSFNTNAPTQSRTEDSDRISGATLNRLLDVCSQALSSAQSTNNRNLTEPKLLLSNSTNSCRIRKWASTGRLTSSSNEDLGRLEFKQFSNFSKKVTDKHNGSGDGGQ